MSDREQIETAIAALTAQRAQLGDTVFDLAVAPLRARLAALDGAAGDDAMPVQLPLQSLRLVTILFLDVVGSTSLSQHLDPEDIHALLDGLLARCTAIVTSFGGKVLQYAGDGMLAVFGDEFAREDDAERAVRAGLRLLDEGRLQGDAVLRAHRLDGFDIRVGAHTGSVLLGGGVGAEASIRGIAVSIAARMEQTAPAGALRISRDCYRQVRDRFEVRLQPPLAVKGLDGPVVSYLVVGEMARAFDTSGRGIEGLEADVDGARRAMIGRDDELDLLLGMVAKARIDRSVCLFTVVSDAGVGKTRLLLELERRVERMGTPVLLLHGRAQRHGVNVPYGVLRDLLAWHCEILDSDAPQVARDKLARRFGAAFGDRSAEQSALVGQLIGLDFSTDAHIAGVIQDGRQIRARAFHAVAEFLRLLCVGDGPPVLLLLDDLHWADDGSLDLVEHLATTCADLPVVLGCFARPALLERRDGWGSACPQTRRIELAVLSPDRSAELVDLLLSRIAEPPAALRAVIVENAEGNPFHAEELIGMLIDDGVIGVSADGWTVDAQRLDAHKVPPTLIAVLQARLDALPAGEKLALQRDSVIGPVFWEGALRQIGADSVDALWSLARRDLIRERDESAFVGVREFAFKHHLLHQVTYDTVLRGARREWHRLTADWLVAVTGERIGEHLGLIADHYERANEPARALTYLQRAGEAAYGAGALDAALAYLDRALALIAADDLRQQCDLLSLRATVYNALGRRAQQATDTTRQAQLAEALDDDALRARAARAQALVSLIAGDYAATLDAAERALLLAEKAGGDPTVFIGAMLEKGQALFSLGEFAKAEQCFLAVLPKAAAIERRDLGCVAMNRLNYIAQQHGDFATAASYLERASVLAREAGNPRFEGALLGNLGLLGARIGRYGRARAMLEESLAVSRAIGDRGSVPYALLGLAEVAFHEGDVPRAIAHVREALPAAKAAGDLSCERDCMLVMGECHAALEQVAQANDCFDAFEAMSAVDDRTGLPSVIARADLALRSGRHEQALALATSLVDRHDGGASADRHELRRGFVCHRVLAANGHARADEFLQRSYATLMEQADRLPVDDRDLFLDAVGLHREIIAAWQPTDRPMSRSVAQASDVAPGVP